MARKAFVNGRLIDGTGSDPIESGVLVINDAVIEAMGRADDVQIPGDCEQIDGRGNTIMPGLFDGHMHVTRFPGLLNAHGHITQNLRAVGKLRQCLRWGTTTVANMGGCPENVLLRQAIEEGHVSGCSRLIVAAMVNPTGGHVRGRAADGPWEVRKAVREMLTAGADLIKTSASGGFQWKHEELSTEDYTMEELKALVDETHAKRRRVAVHAHAQPGLDHSIEAGCDIIMHGAMIDEKALEGIAANNLYYMPTLYITSERVFSKPGLPEHMKERMAKAHPVHRAGVRKAHEMALTIAAGTDGGPGHVMIELNELVACGLSPMGEIVAATRNTADAYGMLDTLGTLEPGKQADVLMVKGNPLDDISLLMDQENILMVLRDGEVETSSEEVAL